MSHLKTIPSMQNFESKFCRASVLGIILIGLLSGCVEVKDTDEVQAPAPVITEPLSNEAEVLSQPLPTTDSVPSEEPPTETAVPRNDLQINEVVYAHQGRLYNQTDLNYELYKNPQFLKKPSDFLLKYDRLVLGPEAVIYTMGNTVRLQAAELITENSMIATFPQGTKAPDYVDGRHGGHISLIFDKAVGSLNIIMRGENGGAGEVGRPPDDSLTGADGVKTVEAQCTLPDAANKGKQGGKGFPGSNGRPGGNSGTLELTVHHGPSFHRHIKKEPGAGGPGGLGGLGGIGGRNIDDHRCFLQPRLPPRGPTGFRGDSGKPGAIGVEQIVCLNQGKTCY